MSTILEDPKRRTVPRWRSWRDAVQVGDVDVSIKTRLLEKPSPAQLMKAKLEWEANRSVPFAGDFMGAAYALGEGHVAKEAAEFILKARSATSKAVRDLASLVLHDQNSVDRGLTEPPIFDIEDRRLRIRKLRTSLREFPRNPLAYMDLAREYVGLGQPLSAVKPVKIALALAPNSRFVLRSACRFFLHFNDPEQAHSILRKADRVKADPWLLAAEIAVADVVGRTSSLVKIGRQFVDSEKFPPSQISELASALGTLVSETGNIRLGKRLFRRALVEPTENVVAQAGWISRHIGDLQLSPHVLDTPGSYEARTWANLFDSHWTDSVAAAGLWLRDEPFASRPAVFGSWAAMSMTTNFELAERFAIHGLRTHPNEFLLLNNLVVSLACQGRISEAVNRFEQIKQADAEGTYKATYLATKGLIQFRLGSPDAGRCLYRMAILEAKGKRDTRSAVWALIHFAGEESRFDPIKAQCLIQEAVADLYKLPKPQQTIATRLIERLPYRYSAFGKIKRS